VMAVPEAPIDSLTLQAAAQLRERLARSTSKDALRVTPESDVDGTFTQEGPTTLSARDYAGVDRLATQLEGMPRTRLFPAP